MHIFSANNTDKHKNYLVQYILVLILLYAYDQFVISNPIFAG